MRPPGRSIEPEQELRLALETREGMLKPFASRPVDFDPLPLVNRFYDYRVAKTAALLVHANRNAEAQEFARKAVAAVPSSQPAVERGLSGHVPEDVVPRAQREAMRKLMP